MKQFYALPLLLLGAIQNANATATANADNKTMIQGSGSINIDVLANDTSNLPNSDLFIANYDQFTSSYGSIVLNEDDTLTYTPNENFTGTDTFTYSARDDSGYGSSATVTIQVLAQVSAFEGFVTGSRNQAVAAMLDSACNSEGTSNKLGRGCGELALQAREDGNLDDAVSKIAPDEALAQRRLLAESSRNKTSRLYQSIAQLRSSNGSAILGVNDRILPSGGGAGDNLGSPWTLLTSVQTEHSKRNKTDKEAGYDSSSAGALLGFGYRVDNELNLGAALDWSSYDVDFTEQSGNLSSDIYSLTGFLSYYKGPFHLDLQAGYTSGDTDAKRVLTFPDAADAYSSYGSQQWNLSSQLEWAWQAGALGVHPFARLDYINTTIDAFAETGDSIWNMAADEQNHELLNASLGLDTSYAVTTSWGVFIPSVKFSAINQKSLSNDPVNFWLIDAGSLGNFQLSSDSADNLFYEWSLSTAFVLRNGVSTFISGRSVSNYNDSSAYQISGGINWEF